jgi:hypothetical protein
MPPKVNLKAVMDKKSAGVKTRSKKSVKKRQNAARKSVGDEETRATFIIDECFLDRLKAIAYWERKQIKTVFHESLTVFFKLKGEDYVKDALERYRSKDQ